MVHKNYLVYGLALLLTVIVLYAIVSFFSSLTIASLFTKTRAEGASLQTIITGTTEEGNVAIAITPTITDTAVILSTEMNTHSVDLEQFDLANMVVLETGEKGLTPSSTFTPQGHHASGEIKFVIEEKIDSFTVTITGIPKIEQRTYQWEVKL